MLKLTEKEFSDYMVFAENAVQDKQRLEEHKKHLATVLAVLRTKKRSEESDLISGYRPTAGTVTELWHTTQLIKEYEAALQETLGSIEWYSKRLAIQLMVNERVYTWDPDLNVFAEILDKNVQVNLKPR